MSCPVSGHESLTYPELEHKSLATGWWYEHKWIMHSVIKDLLTEMIPKFFLDMTNMYMEKKLCITWFSNFFKPPILSQYTGKKRTQYLKASCIFSCRLVAVNSCLSHSQNSATVFVTLFHWDLETKECVLKSLLTQFMFIYNIQEICNYYAIIKNYKLQLLLSHIWSVCYLLLCFILWNICAIPDSQDKCSNNQLFILYLVGPICVKDI